MNFYQILTFSAAVFLLMNRISKSEGRQENPRQNERDKGRCRSGEVHVQPQGSSKYLLIGQVLLESHQWEGSLVSKVMLNIDKFRNVSRSFHEWLGNGFKWLVSPHGTRSWCGSGSALVVLVRICKSRCSAGGWGFLCARLCAKHFTFIVLFDVGNSFTG